MCLEMEWKKHMERNVFFAYHVHVLILSPLAAVSYRRTGIHVPIRITHLYDVICSSDNRLCLYRV